MIWRFQGWKDFQNSAFNENTDMKGRFILTFWKVTILFAVYKILKKSKNVCEKQGHVKSRDSWKAGTREKQGLVWKVVS